MKTMTDETKAQLFRKALGELAGEYMAENRTKEAQGVLSAQQELNSSSFQKVGSFNETYSRLYEKLLKAAEG